MLCGMSGLLFGGRLATGSLRRIRKSILQLGCSRKCLARRLPAACCCRPLECNAAIRGCLPELEARLLLSAKDGHTHSHRISVLVCWRLLMILARGRAQAMRDTSLLVCQMKGQWLTMSTNICVEGPSDKCTVSPTETNIPTYSPLLSTEACGST